MISEEKFQIFKQEVIEKEEKHNQMVGMKKQIEATLKKDFGCKTIVQARNLLKKLRKEKKESESKFWEDFKLYKTQDKQYHKKLEAADKQ